MATALLSDLVERGLDPEQGILFVIDGAKALRKAIRNVFGQAPVQRCLRHKERNVTEHLPEREQPAVRQRLRRAWALERSRSRAGAAPPTRWRARPQLPRCGRLATRRDGRNADAHPARRPRLAQAHARIDEPVRVDDRDRPPHPRNVKRWSWVRWRCAGPPPACSKPNGSFGRSSATATSPRSSSRSNATTIVAVTARHRLDQGGRYRRSDLTITPGPPSRNSTTGGTSSKYCPLGTRPTLRGRMERTHARPARS